MFLQRYLHFVIFSQFCCFSRKSFSGKWGDQSKAMDHRTIFQEKSSMQTTCHRHTILVGGQQTPDSYKNPLVGSYRAVHSCPDHSIRWQTPAGTTNRSGEEAYRCILRSSWTDTWASRTAPPMGPDCRSLKKSTRLGAWIEWPGTTSHHRKNWSAALHRDCLHMKIGPFLFRGQHASQALLQRITNLGLTRYFYFSRC